MSQCTCPAKFRENYSTSVVIGNPDIEFLAQQAGYCRNIELIGFAFGRADNEHVADAFLHSMSCRSAAQALGPSVAG